MSPLLLLLTGLLVISCRAEPEADPADDVLRAEIESAALESRQLADELSSMLARLELEEDREEAVEAAVVGDQETVEEALKEMVDKIEDLAQASENSNLDNLAGLVSQKRVKEEELRKTLEQLELVADQIEEAASSADSLEDVDTIEKIAKLLQSVSDKIKDNTGDDDEDTDEEVFRKQFGSEQSETGLELNGISEMIKSLEKVTTDLKGLNDDDLENEKENVRNAAKGKFDFELLNLDLNSIGEDDDDRSFKSRDRKGKSFAFDDSNVKEEEISEEKEVEKKARAPKQLSEDEFSDEKEDDEECEEKTVTDKVKVCVPDFKTKDSTVELYSAVVEEERHCFNVTKTVCEESSTTVSKEVCVYDYQQKTVVAPAQMTEVTFARRHEKLGVTVCSPGPSYKEECSLKYEEAGYRVPSIAEYIDDFVELNIPEPRKNCRVFEYEIPEVTCRDMTTEECRDISYLTPSPVTEHLETVQLEYKGNCEQRELEQTQQICTKTVTVKKPNHSYGG